MPVLAIRTQEGGLLGAIAPLGLAASAPGPALVVDLDPSGPNYPGRGSLASLVGGDGPRRADLDPGRARLAVLRNGGVGSEDSDAAVAALASSWPFCVLRLAPMPDQAEVEWPLVEVASLVPGDFFSPGSRRVVYQDVGWGIRPPAHGLRLPKPRPASVRALASGVRPLPDRWTRAWGAVWHKQWH